MVGHRNREAARPEYRLAGNSCKLPRASTLAIPVTVHDGLGQAHGRKLKLAFTKLHNNTRHIVISNEAIISLISTKLHFP